MSVPVSPLTTVTALRDFADRTRAAVRQIDQRRQSALGQFFTPSAIAALMASLSNHTERKIRLLDPGAGVGVLTAAWIQEACLSDHPPEQIAITAFEIDETLGPSLRSVLTECRDFADGYGVDVTFDIYHKDFIRTAVDSLNGGMFGAPWPLFNATILNPPYGKFRVDSTERKLLRDVGIETSNLYTAFVALHCAGSSITAS